MNKTPLSQVKEKFGSKEQLVAAIEKLATADLWLDRVNENRGLARVSNAKLLRLHAALEDAQQRFGSRAKLIDAVLEAEKRAKDEGYRTRLEGYPLPRLLDLHASAQKRAARAAEKKPVAPRKKKRRSKKAAAATAGA